MQLIPRESPTAGVTSTSTWKYCGVHYQELCEAYVYGYNQQEAYMSYTTSVKLREVSFTENNWHVDWRFGGCEKVVWDWKGKNGQTWGVYMSSCRSQQIGCKLHWPELEEKLMECVSEKRMNGIGLLGSTIRSKENGSEMHHDTVLGFTCSSSWLHYWFMKKNSLVWGKDQNSSSIFHLPQEFEDKICEIEKGEHLSMDYGLQQIATSVL